MKLSELELPVLHDADRRPLPSASVWLMLGYPSATKAARPLAAWLQRLALQSNGALPIVVVSGLDRDAAAQEAAALGLEVPFYLDDTDGKLLRSVSCCGRPFVAVVRDDVVIAIACAKYLDDLAGVVQIALLEAGIEHLDARPTFAWCAPSAADLAA